MKLTIEQTNKGRPCLLIGKYKYRESYVSKSGDVTWRCLAKNCGASVKTNSARTDVLSHDNGHTGSHPVTLRTVSRSASPSTPNTPSAKLPFSPLVSQKIIFKDTRDAFTETDPLFLSDKDELINKINEQKNTLSALVDKIQELTCELEEKTRELNDLREASLIRESAGSNCLTDTTSPSNTSLPSPDTGACCSDECMDTWQMSGSQPISLNIRNGLLTDDEVWAGLSGLRSNLVHVLTPSECLTIRLCPTETFNKTLFNLTDTKVILAPINNADPDLNTNLNTEGTHWSLIVIDLIGRKYLHMDSLPGLNYLPALDFAKNCNKILKLGRLVFRQKKCEKQNDGFSCGHHVIKNAKNQAELYSAKFLNNLDDNVSVPVSPVSCSVRVTAKKCFKVNDSNNVLSNKVSKQNRSNIFIIGDSHVRGIAGILQPFLPNYNVTANFYPGAPMEFILNMLCNMKNTIKTSDIVVLMGGTNVTSADHCSRLKGKLFNLINTFPCQIVLTEIPWLTRQTLAKRSEIEISNKMLLSLSVHTNTPFLLINHFLTGKHYVRSGQHLNHRGKVQVCDGISKWLSFLLMQPLKEHTPCPFL